MRVAVVGSGVIGLCCAYELKKRGHEVVVLERGQASDDNCSNRNAGMIVPSHFVPLAAPGMAAMGLRMMRDPKSPFTFAKSASVLGWGVKFLRAATRERAERAAPVLLALNLASKEGYRRLARELPRDFGLVEKGLLMLCRDPHRMEEERQLAAEAERLGLKVRVLDPGGLRALEPELDMDVLGGVHFEDDAHLTPEALQLSLRESLGEECIRFGSPVEAWALEGGKVRAAKTPCDEVEADAFVLATGADTPSATRGLGLRLPMVGGKGYSFTVESPPQMPEICAILAEARVAVTPVTGGLRFAGTMELGAPDCSIREPRVQGIRESISRYYPAFKPEHLQGQPLWAGRRPCTPDGLPYLGRPRSITNLVVAAGHAMMGLSLAPVTAALVGQILDGEPSSIPLDLLSPDRYA